MFPTSRDCTVSTGVVVGGEAPMETLVNPETGEVTFSLGSHVAVEVVFDGRSLARFVEMAQDALRVLDETDPDRAPDSGSDAIDPV